MSLDWHVQHVLQLPPSADQKSRQLLQCNTSPSAPSIWLNRWATEKMTCRLRICVSYQTTCSAWFWSTELKCLPGHYWTQFWHQHSPAEIQRLSQHVDREDKQTWLFWIKNDCDMRSIWTNFNKYLHNVSRPQLDFYTLWARLLRFSGWLLGEWLTFFFFVLKQTTIEIWIC